MTISSNVRKAGPFTGNGTASAFPFYFKVFQASDLLVVKLTISSSIETTLALTTDYTVTLNSDQDSNPGGTVTLVAGALATGFTLTITSDIGNLQPTDLTNQGGFYPEVIEDSLDRATIQIQQLAEEANRALTLPLSTPSSVSTELPPPQANYLIAWNEDADGLQNVSTGDVATIASYGATRAELFSGTGSQTVFTLSENPGATANLDVSISGVTQRNGIDFNWVSGTNLTFMTAPPAGTNNILVRYVRALPAVIASATDVQFTPAGTGAVTRPVQTKLRETVSVEDFGAVGDGVADDTAAIKAALAAHDNLYFPKGTYLIDTVNDALVPTGKNSMYWSGYGATIKAKNGATATGNSRMLRLANCSNVVIEGLTFDGNRANRSSFASGSHCIQINDGDNLVFRDLFVINSTYDGIYVRGTTPGTQSTYSTNIVFDNVVVDNAYRNGVSLIGANGVTINGGRFTNTNGTAPQAGIDIEPNASDTFSVKNVLIDGAHFEGNAGTGITLTGSSPVFSDNIKLMNISGKANAECFILAAEVSNLIIDGASVSGDTTIPTRPGIVTILNFAKETVIRNIDFRDITGVTATKALIYTEDGAAYPRYINNVRASNVSCQTILCRSSNTHIDGVQVDNDSATEPTIYAIVGSYCSIKNVAVYNKTASAQALRVASTFTDVDNVTIVDFIVGVRMQGANNKYRNITLLENGTASAVACFMDTATGVVIENVNISDTGGYYTNSTVFGFAGGLTSLAGARFRNVYPSPLMGSTTWDPASINDGASATTTVSVTRADIGDYVNVGHSVSLAGLISTAYVSAANTVTVVLANTTGAPVDLASHTVTVEAIK